MEIVIAFWLIHEFLRELGFVDKHAVLGNKRLTKVGDGFETALRKVGLKAISAKALRSSKSATVTYLPPLKVFKENCGCSLAIA